MSRHLSQNGNKHGSMYGTMFKAVFSAALISAVMLFAANPAYAQQAQTLGQLTGNLYSSSVHIQTFLSLLAYILGIFFCITGIIGLRAHVEDPGRNPLKGPLLRMGAAAFFIFTPTFANLLINSIGGSSNGLNFSNAVEGNAQGQGLEVVLNRLMHDIAPQLLDNLIPFLAYAAGVIFMLVGLKRLALANGDGPQAPGGLGTIGTFFVAAALMSFGSFVAALEGSLFGQNTIINSPTFMGGDSSAQLTEHANQAMWGVFIFLRIVGYISVLRGLFRLRAAGEGGNVPMLEVGVHMIAGALLINATGFVMAVQAAFLEPSDYILQ